MKISSGILVLGSVVITSFAASIPKIEAGIRAISSSVAALDKSVTALPSKGANLMQALAIKTDFERVRVSLEKSTSDIKSTPHFSEGDGKAIFKLFQASAPTFIRALSNLVAKKAAIEGLPVNGIKSLVQKALKTLHSGLDEFENAMIASEPNSVKGQLKKIKASIDAAFHKAVAAYD